LIPWLLLLAAALAAALLKGFRRWLSSMAGAIWILVALTVLSLVGVVVEQNLPLEAYTDHYGQAVGTFVYRAGLSSIFTSWYFLGLAAVLAVSLVACTLGRLVRPVKAGGRRRLSRAGSLILHASMVIILAGGVATAVLGFRYAAPTYLEAGDEMEIPEGDFDVRVEAAVTEFAPNGMVSEYYSDVVVVKDGEDVLSHRIEVNDPLIYNGIGLYQNQMLPSATSVKEVVLGIVMTAEGGDEPPVTLVVPFQEEYTIPGTDVTLEVLEFLADFTYDIETRTAHLASLSHRNPAVLIRVSQAGEFVADRWVFADTQAHRDDSGLPCRVYLLDYVPDFDNGITRFEVSRQPGTPLLFVGFAAMSLGLALTFWTRGSAGEG
jgi:cytochrome c biogenesis protein